MTWLLGLTARVKMYAVLAAAAIAAIGIALLKARSSGAQSEKLKQIQNTLERKRIEYDVAATNAAVDAAVRRERLRKRWERR